MAQLNAIERLRGSPPARVITVEQDVPRNPTFMPLDNRIHPLFRYHAWRNVDYEFAKAKFGTTRYSLSEVDRPQNNITQKCYSRLLGAIQLASLLLERAAPLLIRIRTGPIVDHPDGAKELDPNWEPTADDYEQYEKDLLQMSKSFRVLYRRAKVPTTKGALTAALSDVRINADIYANPQAPPLITLAAICADTLVEFDNDAQWHQGDPHSKCAIRVALADTLVHEVTHCIYYERQIQMSAHIKGWNLKDRCNRIEYEAEPQIWPETYAELGISVTRFLWGGWNLKLCDDYYRTRWDGPAKTNILRPRFDGNSGLEATRGNDSGDQSRMVYRTVCKGSHIDFLNKYTWDAPQLKYYVHCGPANKFRSDSHDQPAPSLPKTNLSIMELREEVAKFNARHGSLSTDSVNSNHLDLFRQEVYDGDYNAPHNSDTESSDTSSSSDSNDSALSMSESIHLSDERLMYASGSR